MQLLFVGNGQGARAGLLKIQAVGARNHRHADSPKGFNATLFKVHRTALGSGLPRGQYQLVRPKDLVANLEAHISTLDEIGGLCND